MEEFPIPYLLLGLPVDDEALLYGTSEGELAEVGTLADFGCDVDLAVAIAGEAVGNDTRCVGGLG